jgi:hypothetical protein
MTNPPAPSPSKPGPNAHLVPSTAPGASSQAETDATGGADAVPMTPADDGLAGRSDQSKEVVPPAEPGPDARPRSRTPPSPSHPDPDAPGNFLDDTTSTDIPEPNEPG